MKFLRRKESIPYILLIPLLIAMAMLVAYPLYKVVESSFYASSFLAPGRREFVGGENFHWLFTFSFRHDPRWSFFIAALGRTVLWVAGSVTFKVVLGLSGALLLNNKLLKGKSIYKILVIVPWAIPWASGAMMWGWTLNSRFGVLNSLLMSLRLIDRPIAFLAHPTGAFLGTMFVDVWAGLPFMVIMLLSGLQAIPDTLYEAAEIDGAGIFTRLSRITLPLLTPVLLTVTLLSTIWTFNSFDVIWILTRGGPIGATVTLPVAIYQISFLHLRLGGLGRASAMSVAQVLIVTILSVFYIRAIRRQRH